MMSLHNYTNCDKSISCCLENFVLPVIFDIFPIKIVPIFYSRGIYLSYVYFSGASTYVPFYYNKA